jgi:hypothetical protein
LTTKSSQTSSGSSNSTSGQNSNAGFTNENIQIPPNDNTKNKAHLAAYVHSNTEFNGHPFSEASKIQMVSHFHKSMILKQKRKGLNELVISLKRAGRDLEILEYVIQKNGWKVIHFI